MFCEIIFCKKKHTILIIYYTNQSLIIVLVKEKEKEKFIHCGLGLDDKSTAQLDERVHNLFTIVKKVPKLTPWGL